MANSTVSVSFANGFIGDYSKNNEASNSVLTSNLGWSNMQFVQSTDNGRFGGMQGNDLSGTILITDANGVQHAIDGVINWRAPSGTVSTIVFYATGSSHTLATTNGSYVVDPFTEQNGDPHSYIGLTYNGMALTITNGKVTGNAAISNVVSALNDYYDAQPHLSVADVSVNENSGMATVTVTLSAAVASTVTVKYSTVDGSGVAGTDYTATSGTLTFAANQTTRTFQVPITDNLVVDGARSFQVKLTDSTNSAITDNTGVVTIADNDTPAPPTVTGVLAEDAAHTGATPTDSSVVEGGSLVYTVTLSASSGTAREHTLSISGSAASSDYGSLSFSNGVAWKNGDASTGILVVPAGASSFKVTVATTDDSTLENAESLTLTVGSASGTGTITDNDVLSVSAVLAEDAANTGATPADSTVAEGASLKYSVTLSAAALSATEFTLSLGGSASGADYGALSFSDGVAWKNGDPATGIVVVPAGVGSFKVTVATTDDAAIEQAETLTLTIGGVAATGTITDNDSQSVTSVLAEDAAHAGASPTDTSVAEGASLQYTVALNVSSPAATEFTLAVSGTASGSDYGSMSFSDGVAWKNADPSTGILVVPAGVTSFKITVATMDDSAIENAESLVLTVGGVSATGTITDNDSQSVSSVTAEDAAHTGANPVDSSVVEGATLQYTIALNTGSPIATEFTLGIGGTAADADYGSMSFSDGVAWKDGDPSTGKIVVPANVTSFTISVATTDDALVESAESLTLTVGGVAATGTITDNDTHSVTSVAAQNAASLSDTSVIEGGTLKYAVALNTVSVSSSEFSLSVGGTAESADHGALSFSDGVAWKNGDSESGIIVVPAGVSSFTITVGTTDDSQVEASESLVLTVGGVAATGTITDNDVAPPVEPPPVEPPPVVTPPVVTPPVVVPPVVKPPVVTPPVVTPPAPTFGAVLDPNTDDGKSNQDAVTSVVKPEFTISGSSYFSTGGSVRLTATDGTVLSAAALDADALKSGKMNLATPQLDDGEYTFISQVLDASGKVVVQAPVKVTIVTDIDGIAPSIEFAANGGDFNKDGVMDWQQHSVAQMPLMSLEDFALGKAAPQASFGAIIAGTPDAANPGSAVHLTAGAQLLDLSLSAAPAPLDTNTVGVTPMFNFSVTSEDKSVPLADMDASREGVQSRVVIELAPGGVVANDFIKWDEVNQKWYSFLDDQRLDTFDNGATLVDGNGDGKVDRIVITLTDGGWGDEDGLANGVIVDPGMLAQVTPPATPVYSVLLGNGDRCYTTNAGEAAQLALGVGNKFEGARFDALEAEQGGRHLDAHYQPFTKDWYYAAAGDAMPYVCYGLAPGAGFTAAAAGSGVGVDIHLYQNAMGQTQLLSAADAQALGLQGQGFRDMGAKFSTTVESAFTFDAEGYLVANSGNAAVQALVQTLAASYHSTSDAGFVEAVEHQYLEQVTLVGIAHGGAATANDVNAIFGTNFGG